MNNLFSSCTERKRKPDVKGNGGKRDNVLDFRWVVLYVLYLFPNLCNKQVFSFSKHQEEHQGEEHQAPIELTLCLSR